MARVRSRRPEGASTNDFGCQHRPDPVRHSALIGCECQGPRRRPACIRRCGEMRRCHRHPRGRSDRSPPSLSTPAQARRGPARSRSECQPFWCPKAAPGTRLAARPAPAPRIEVAPRPRWMNFGYSGALLALRAGNGAPSCHFKTLFGSRVSGLPGPTRSAGQPRTLDQSMRPGGYSGRSTRILIEQAIENAQNLRASWCGREDSNFHGSYPTATSTLRVYQFRHDRTVLAWWGAT